VAAGAGATKLNEAVAEPDVMNDANPETDLSTVDHLTLLPSYWRWEVILVMFAIITALLWSLIYVSKRFRNSSKRRLKNIQRKELIDGRALQASLLNACKSNDNNVAAELLIKHAKFLFQDSKLQNLGVLATKLSYGAGVIKELEASLYSGNAHNWKGYDLHQLVSQGLQAKENTKTLRQVGLAPLYPN